MRRFYTKDSLLGMALAGIVTALVLLFLSGCACAPDDKTGQCVNWSNVGGWGGTFGGW